MRFMTTAFIAAAAALILASCSTEDPYAPVETLDIDSKFRLQTLWSRSIGGGVGEFYSALTPEFASGTIYAASRNGDVYALNAKSGSTVWRVDLDDEEENDLVRSTRLSGGVAAYAGRVAVGSENGYVYLLNAIDGSLQWKAFIRSEIVSKPVFSKSGATVFVLDNRGRVSAFDAQEGQLKWVSGDAPNVLRLRAQSGMVAVGDDFLVLGQSNGRVSVLLQSTGAIVNQLTVAEISGVNALERISDITATPVFEDSTMYAISYNGGLIIYDFASNRLIARLMYNSSHDLDLDDTSIVLTDDNGHVYCINRADFTERWANTRLSYRSVTAPVIYGNYVVVGDYEGYLYFMDLNNGSIEGMFGIDSSGIYIKPLLADGNLYVSSRDGDIECVSYDPSGLAFSKEAARRMASDYAALGVDLRAPGVGDTGIYAPDAISEADLMARREAVIRAARQAEARQRASEAQMREYEQRRREYEQRIQEERERLSGFGIGQ